MKKLLLLFSCWPFFAFGQIYIDFENGLTGEWDQFPLSRWESSDTEPICGNSSLHHSFDNTIGATDIISLKTGIINTDSVIIWDFLIRHASLPSSSNKWVIMLLSDNPANKLSDKGNFNGYGFGVNLTNNDDSLRLYSFQNGIPVSSISLGMNYEAEAGTEPFHFIIIRDSVKTWVIKGGFPGSNLKIFSQFRLDERILFKSRYFGIRYTYTATRDRLFWLDDLKITACFTTDTMPPSIIDSRILSGKIIKVDFSEELDSASVNRENITLTPGNIQPDSIIITGNELWIFFNDSYNMKEEYFLTINGISDLEGNNADNLLISFIWYEAGLYDLIISEIMSDPQPVVNLPDKEYIEIYNRSSYSIDLDSMVLSTGLRKWTMPRFLLHSGDYAVITNQVTEGEIPAANEIFLFSSASVISNEGQELSLSDKKGTVISAVKFENSWYNDNYKSEGGWSLERIDNENICGETGNWDASKDPSGGTPGRINSLADLNPDMDRPRPEGSIFHTIDQIELTFSESINPNTLTDESLYMPDNQNLIPGIIIPVGPLFKSVIITYPELLVEDIIYSLRLSESITDCSGNPLELNKQIRFGMPSASNFLDVLISEILFNPLAGCPEFIELFNASGRLLELSDIRISVRKIGTIEDKIISAGPFLFFPAEYIVITKDRESLMNFFECRNPGNIIECNDLPVISNEGGCIKILNRSLQPIDEYCYSPKDHFALISDQKGVSLERLRFDKKPGTQSDWHSSSSISGFGTPGYENSQTINDDLIDLDFQIKPEIFSPDNDGKDDIMVFSYVFDKEGYTGTVGIFDPAGRIIKYLARNELLGTSGYLSWDGRDESGRLCRIGIYLVYMEAFHSSGKVRKYKGTVVLARRTI